MDARAVPLQLMLEGTKQYVVPLFQRPYSWEEDEWEALWGDIMDIYDLPDPREHFIGAVVTLPLESTPAGVSKFTLIDGQQRMTTLLILLSVIRDLCREALQSAGTDEGTRTQYAKLPDEIDANYLLNQFHEGVERYRLMPTQLDRDDFELVITGKGGGNGRIETCKSWFMQKIREGRRDEPFNLRKLKNVLIRQLVVVSVELAEDENPYLIFETLNARGTPLTEADLIRNFLFMRLSSNLEVQESAYREKWLPMQRELGGYLTDFFGHFLMEDHGTVRKREVYITMKRHYGAGSADQTRDLLGRLKSHATFYRKLLDPNVEEDTTVRGYLTRLNDWKVSTAYPLLLKLFSLMSERTLSTNQLNEGLGYIESFIVRRFVVGISTRPLNRIFPEVSRGVTRTDAIASLRNGLAARSWPDDTIFTSSLKNAPIYRYSYLGTTRILRSLEESYGHREPPLMSDVSVEHIMPQTLSEEWIASLGEGYEEIHSRYVDTVGNLTLSAYNPELYNRPFHAKKETYARSHLELNRNLAVFDNWTSREIEARALSLTEQALRVWPRPA